MVDDLIDLERLERSASDLHRELNWPNRSRILWLTICSVFLRRPRSRCRTSAGTVGTTSVAAFKDKGKAALMAPPCPANPTAI